MDKDLLRTTIAKIKNLTESEVRKLSIQDVGVLQLYLRARSSPLQERPPEKSDLAVRIERVLRLWQQSARPAENPNDTAPDDSFLNGAVDKLKQERFDEVSTAELELVRATFEVLGNRQFSDDTCDALHATLGSALSDYDAAVAHSGAPAKPEPPAEARTTAQPPRHPRARTANHVDANTFFTQKHRKRVELVDGIEADLAVTVYRLEGETEIDGDVPDETLLVVKDGGITVNGFVSGNIIASEDIAIHGNICGSWVISQTGSIQADKVLPHSRVIAKHGTLHAASGEAPACVFAWGGLHIHGDVIGGKLLGRTIHVDGSVAGAELHAVGSITAGSFDVVDNAATVICLRDILSCEDYGQPMEETQRKLYRGIGKRTHDAAVLNKFLRYSSRDIEDSRRTVLYFLLGGLVNVQGVRSLRGLQCQANLLTEITDSMERLQHGISRVLAAGHPLNPRDAHSAARQCIDSLQHVTEDIQVLAASFDLAHKGSLLKACRDVTSMAENLGKGAIPQTELPHFLAELRQRHAQYIQLSRQLAAGVEEQTKKLPLDAAAVKTIETQPEKLETMISQVMTGLAKKPDSEGFRRSKSSVVRLLQTRITRDSENIQNWKEAYTEAEKEVETIRQHLGDTASILFAAPGAGASVNARAFDCGVILVANPAIDSNPLETATATHTIRQSVNTPTTFILQNGAIRQE